MVTPGFKISEPTVQSSEAETSVQSQGQPAAA
jgi:hypothetical protein